MLLTKEKNMKQRLIIIATFIFYLVTCSVSFADVLFSEDFNNLPDWQPSSANASCDYPSCTTPPVENWTYFRNDEKWHPSSFSDKQPTLQISTQHYRGNSGKAYTQWNESHSGTSGDGWGADGILQKVFDQDHNELYIQLYVLFQQNFQLYHTGYGEALIKLIRFMHWDRTGSSFRYFTNGYSCPAYIFDIGDNDWGFRQKHAFRCDPQESNYYCGGDSYGDQVYNGSPSFNELYGDGQWHQLRWHIKMNSQPGANNGIIEFWVDGTKQFSRSDMQWMGAGSPGNIGWNTFGIGGNAYNSYAPETQQAEQWYAIDDIVISTTSFEDPISIPTIPTPTIQTISNNRPNN